MVVVGENIVGKREKDEEAAAMVMVETELCVCEVCEGYLRESTSWTIVEEHICI